LLALEFFRLFLYIYMGIFENKITGTNNSMSMNTPAANNQPLSQALPMADANTAEKTLRQAKEEHSGLQQVAEFGARTAFTIGATAVGARFGGWKGASAAGAAASGLMSAGDQLRYKGKVDDFGQIGIDAGFGAITGGVTGLAVNSWVPAGTLVRGSALRAAGTAAFVGASDGLILGGAQAGVTSAYQQGKVGEVDWGSVAKDAGTGAAIGAATGGVLGGVSGAVAHRFRGGANGDHTSTQNPTSPRPPNDADPTSSPRSRRRPLTLDQDGWDDPIDAATMGAGTSSNGAAPRRASSTVEPAVTPDSVAAAPPAVEPVELGGSNDAFVNPSTANLLQKTKTVLATSATPVVPTPVDPPAAAVVTPAAELPKVTSLSSPTSLVPSGTGFGGATRAPKTNTTPQQGANALNSKLEGTPKKLSTGGGRQPQQVAQPPVSPAVASKTPVVAPAKPTTAEPALHVIQPEDISLATQAILKDADTLLPTGAAEFVPVTDESFADFDARADRELSEATASRKTRDGEMSAKPPVTIPTSTETRVYLSGQGFGKEASVPKALATEKNGAQALNHKLGVEEPAPSTQAAHPAAIKTAIDRNLTIRQAIQNHQATPDGVNYTAPVMNTTTLQTLSDGTDNYFGAQVRGFDTSIPAKVAHDPARSAKALEAVLNIPASNTTAKPASRPLEAWSPTGAASSIHAKLLSLAKQNEAGAPEATLSDATPTPKGASHQKTSAIETPTPPKRATPPDVEPEQTGRMLASPYMEAWHHGEARVTTIEATIPWDKNLASQSAPAHVAGAPQASPTKSAGIPPWSPTGEPASVPSKLKGFVGTEITTLPASTEAPAVVQTEAPNFEVRPATTSVDAGAPLTRGESDKIASLFETHYGAEQDTAATPKKAYRSASLGEENTQFINRWITKNEGWKDAATVSGRTDEGHQAFVDSSLSALNRMTPNQKQALTDYVNLEDSPLNSNVRKGFDATVMRTDLDSAFAKASLPEAAIAYSVKRGQPNTLQVGETFKTNDLLQTTHKEPSVIFLPGNPNTGIPTEQLYVIKVNQGAPVIETAYSSLDPYHGGFLFNSGTEFRVADKNSSGTIIFLDVLPKEQATQ
jgi:hypothetical protein